MIDYIGKVLADAWACHLDNIKHVSTWCECCAPVVPCQRKEPIWLEQSMTLFQGKVCINKMDAMHDGDQGCHPPMLCYFLVHLGCADRVDGHSTLKRLGVRFR